MTTSSSHPTNPVRALDESRLRTSIRLVAQFLLPLLILGGGVVGFQLLSGLHQPPPQRKPDVVVPLVKTARVQSYGDRPFVIDVDGVVVPHREVQIAAEITGRVTHKSEQCRVGTFVEASTVLFRIDDEEAVLEQQRLQQEKRQAELALAEVAVQKANLEQVIALQTEDVAIQQEEWERNKRLLAREVTNAAAVEQSRRALLSSQNTLLGSENQLRLLTSKESTLQAAVNLVDQRLKRNQLDLRRAEIRAPVPGVIVEEHVEQDSFIQRGSVLVTLEDTRQADVLCNLRMNELYWIWAQRDPQQAASGSQAASYDLPDTPVKVNYELNGLEFQWDGVLTRYDGLGLDERTRTVPCRIDVLEPTRVSINGTTDDSTSPIGAAPALVRGMFVNVKVETRPRVNLLTVPEMAVQPDGFIWKVDAEDRLQRIQVRLAAVADGVSVISGENLDLAAGDRVVISPLESETSGTLVQEQGDE